MSSNIVEFLKKSRAKGVPSTYQQAPFKTHLGPNTYQQTPFKTHLGPKLDPVHVS